MCAGRNPCLRLQSSFGIGTADRMRRANTEAKAGSDKWTPAFAREAGFRCVLEFGNGIVAFAPSLRRHSCVGRNLCVSGVFSLGIGTAGRV